MSTELFQIVRILSLATAAFVLAMLLTPLWEKVLSRYRLGKQIRAEGAPVFASLHAKKSGTPTMGGVIIWGTTILLLFLLWGISRFTDGFWGSLNFFSRGGTRLPFGVLLGTALVGLIDDFMGILRVGPKGGGLRIREKLVVSAIIAAIGAWWFYSRLGREVLHIPFLGDFNLGIWYALFFIVVLVATSHSVNITDGLDGLAGGTLLFAFGALTVIAFTQGMDALDTSTLLAIRDPVEAQGFLNLASSRFDLAVFTAVIAGSLVAFLWWNVFPARFFMGDTGAMALGITLGVIAMLTNTALLLPFFGSVFALESLSVIVQVLSKKFRGKKIFLSAPIHHHFEAKGWPETQVTMRFWIISGVSTAVGLVIYFLERSL